MVDIVNFCIIRFYLLGLQQQRFFNIVILQHRDFTTLSGIIPCHLKKVLCTLSQLR